ncbi:MAG: DUF4349 domain-containing protein [Candidatus Izemoplasma sp.]|nr:DUF4349 domain-containing protein [Candidatus Izemoplasma sp.]
MMKRFLTIIFIFITALTLSSCSSADEANYLPDDYYNADDEGAQETPDYDQGDVDLSNGGEILQADTPTLPNRKIIYEADISLLTEDLMTSYETVTSTLTDYTAYIEAENITDKQVDVVIRVLSIEFDDLVNDLKTSGELLSYQKNQ